jgi:hypothetical protein
LDRTNKVYLNNRVETVDGSAVSGEDFVPVDQVIEFQPKEVVKEVRISPTEFYLF